MREITKPSTAQCNLDIYTLFLLSEPKYGGCSRLAEILGDVSHDSVNRFLLRERYEPKDLFSIIEKIINLEGGILSVDDTVIEKIYSDPKNAELISWSSHHRSCFLSMRKSYNIKNLYIQSRDFLACTSKLSANFSSAGAIAYYTALCAIAQWMNYC